MSIPYSYYDYSIITNLESTTLLFYTINQDPSIKVVISETADGLIDDYFSKYYFKYLPQNKSLCLNVMRFFSNTFEQQTNYFDQILQNPCIIYKNMPFSITFVMTDCNECLKQRMDYLNAVKDLKKDFMDTNNTNKEEYQQRTQTLFKNFMQNKSSIAHTRQIEIQISISQNIFQNDFQYDQQILQHLSTFQLILQKCYSKFYNHLELHFNPTRDPNQNIFSFRQRQLTGTLLNKTTQILQNAYMKILTRERLEAIYKSIKIFTCTLNRILRYVYFMNLIGKDSNNLNTLNEDLPVFEFEVSEEQKKQQIFCIISRESLIFDLFLKIRLDQKTNQFQIYYTSTNLKDNQGLTPEKIFEYREAIQIMFRSLNYVDYDMLALPQQIKHITNLYQAIISYYKNPSDKDIYNIYLLIRIISENKIIFDISKKDVEMQDIGDQKIQNPKYIMELTSYNDLQKQFVFKYKIFFGRDNDNKLFALIEKPENKKSVHYMQINEIKQYIHSLLNEPSVI